MVLESVRRLRDPRVLTAAEVPASQILLAASGYVVLALGARSLPVASFALLSSFYLLLNTVGRGVFASVELETSRAVAAAVAAGRSSLPTQTLVARRTVVLLGLAIVLSLGSAPLLPAGGRDLAFLLAGGAVAMAISYGVRGPLAALRRYHGYSATFVVEAGSALAGSVLLTVSGTDRVELWALVLVVSPVIGAAATAGVLLRGRLTAKLALHWRERTSHVRDVSPHDLSYVSLGALLWTTVFYLSSQGVWNLAPVAVTSRLTLDPEAAAGFVSIAVVLRAPVFVFPALQSVLLPIMSAAAQRGDRRSIQRGLAVLLAVLGGCAALWMVLAVTVVPWVTRLAFGATDLPSTGVIALLAASTMVGAAAFVVQTRALAYRRHRAIALAWLAGLVTLLAVGFLPLPAEISGATAQLTAAAVVLTGIVLGDRAVRRSTTPVGP